MPDENLALGSAVRVSSSGLQPTGGGARDPHVLLNEIANHLDGQALSKFRQEYTFDTYDGQNLAVGPDWIAIDFGEPVAFNCLEMTMGFAYRDGGWWASLAIEIQVGVDGPWCPVTPFACSPEYDFNETRGERRSFDTHMLSFESVRARAVRLIGRPSGTAQFISLARLAVYYRDLSRWNPTLARPPVPDIFRLIPPATMWDLSESFAKLTGVAIEFPLIEYYLDGGRYERFLSQVQRNYMGRPELWFLLGDAMGWEAWRATVGFDDDQGSESTLPHVVTFMQDMLARASAPIILGSRRVGSIVTQPVLLKEAFDLNWHRQNAAKLAIAWPIYRSALDRSPAMSYGQLEGAAEFLGLIATSIAELAHHNMHLSEELAKARGTVENSEQRRQRTVKQAIQYMQENLENNISVVDVARHVAVSQPYFTTLFAAEMKQNPRDYLIDLRLARAKEYLAHSDFSVMDVSVALGYSPSYFSRLFKRQVGCTPGEYARRSRGDNVRG